MRLAIGCCLLVITAGCREAIDAPGQSARAGIVADFEHDRQRRLAQVLFGEGYAGFEASAIKPIDLALTTGAAIESPKRDPIRRWRLGRRADERPGRMQIESERPGQDLAELLGPALVEWGHVAHGYPENFVAAGDELLRASPTLHPEPFYFRKATKSAAGYDWILTVTDARPSGGDRPVFMITVEWRPLAE